MTEHRENHEKPENRLIEWLPQPARLQLLRRCQPVALVPGDVLASHGAPTSQVYFPTEGFISLMATVEGKPALEVGMVGREGMLGAELALGVAASPWHALVIGPGTAWRVDSEAFEAELAASPALAHCLRGYLHVLMSQLVTASACQRFHMLGPRLARWLLMSQDRSQGERLVATHDSLAHALGVRRVGVTMAAGALQRQGLIEYHRGQVVVLDRDGLERAACSCYAQDQLSYGAAVG